LATQTIKIFARISGLIVLAILVSYFLAAGWWWLWMYQGWIGPVPFLHWFIWSDGEGSYNLTLNEMWITAFVFLVVIWLIAARARQRR